MDGQTFNGGTFTIDAGAAPLTPMALTWHSLPGPVRGRHAPMTTEEREMLLETPAAQELIREAAERTRERCAAVAAERAGNAFMWAPEMGGMHQRDAGRVATALDVAAAIRALPLE